MTVLNKPRAFGTGGDDDEKKGPGLMRTAANGFAFGLGWIAAISLVGVVVKAFKDRPDEPVNPDD